MKKWSETWKNLLLKLDTDICLIFNLSDETKWNVTIVIISAKTKKQEMIVIVSRRPNQTEFHQPNKYKKINKFKKKPLKSKFSLVPSAIYFLSHHKQKYHPCLNH